MNRRGFLGILLGTTVGALFFKVKTPPVVEAMPTHPVFACGFESGVYDGAHWIIDPRCPDDTIYFIDRKKFVLSPSRYEGVKEHSYANLSYGLDPTTK